MSLLQHPLPSVQAYVQAFSDAPLPVLRQDELGGLTVSINRMSSQLRQLVGEIQGAVAQVEGAGREVGQTTNAIVDDLASQNQRLDTVAAAIEQMSASTRDVAGNIADAAGAARQTEQQARQGEQALARMSVTMAQIAAMITQANQAMSLLRSQSEQVGRVTEVIATIAPVDSQERFEGFGVTVLRDWARFISPTEVQAGEHIVTARRFVIATDPL